MLHPLLFEVDQLDLLARADVLSMTPELQCLSLVRTNAPPCRLDVLDRRSCTGAVDWIFRPSESAVDTCIRSGPFPSLSLEAERRLEALSAGHGPVAAEQTQEDLRRSSTTLSRQESRSSRYECRRQQLLGRSPPGTFRPHQTSRSARDSRSPGSRRTPAQVPHRIPQRAGPRYGRANRGLGL